MIGSNFAFDRARDELASLLMSDLPSGQRTLMVELVAAGFIDGYANACRTGRFGELVTWIDRTCQAHADAPGVAALFSGACTTLERYLARNAQDERFRAPLRTLNAPVRAVAAKARRLSVISTERLDETDAAINALLVRLDSSDPLTAEHSRAVSAWCTRLARRLSLSDEDTTFVARCGMIHDIGKITTPKEILFAPRALTDDEWNVMRSHTAAGERIVREDRRLHRFTVAVRSHHERLDGRGYPDQLTANEIDLPTRIVTIADSFNAMIGRRPYRPPMLPAQALEQLAANKKKQFDPEIVSAMFEVVREL